MLMLPALALVLSLATPAPLRSSDLEEVLVELRIGRLSATTVRALRDGQIPLLPVGKLLEMGEVEHAVGGDGTLRAVLHPGARLVVVAPDRETAVVGERPVLLEPGWVVWDGETLFLAVPALERLFGLDMLTDWESLTVVVLDAEALPVGRRVRREAERKAALAGAARRPPDLRLAPERNGLSGLVADWSVAASADDPAGSAAYSLGVGAHLLGGALQATAQSLGPIDAAPTRVDVTYQTVWRDRPWLTQLRLGDGFATGPRLRSLRGVALTNAPYLRSSEFGVEAIAGRVGPGWEVEVRQSGRLVDASRADEAGAFALDIPLHYGDNAIQLVAFGPHGQVVTAERLVRLAAERLPGGRFEWGTSLGHCREPRCTATANLDLRHGLSDRWTARLGVDRFWRDTLADLTHVYAGLVGALTPAWQVSAEGVTGGFARALTAFEPTPHLRGRIAQTYFTRSTVAPVLHDGRRRSTTEAQVLVRPVPELGRWFFEGAYVRQALSTVTLTDWRAVQSVQLGEVRFDGGLRGERFVPAVGPASASLFQAAAGSALLRLGRRDALWLRAEAEVQDARRLYRWRLQAAKQLARDFRLEVAGGWVKPAGMSLTMTLATYLPTMRTLSQLFWPEGSVARLTQVAEGTVQWDGVAGRLALGPGPGLERGGLSGRVFLDANGNGAFDRGERTIPGVRIHAGPRSVATDEDGRYHVWELVPFEPLRVQVDSLSLVDPRHVPTYGEVEVHIPPSTYRRLDIPVAVAGEITGRVVVETKRGPVAAGLVRLELVNRETGERRSFETFSDGEFYLADVRPGRYDLMVPTAPLAAVGLRPEPTSLQVVLEPAPGGPRIEGLLVRLVPIS